MPINAFGGEPGSGKTYGVMEHVILPAIAQGRFIITNIEGLNEEAIYEYVASTGPKDKIICIGHIRHCGRDAPDSDDFFPNGEQLDRPCPVPELECQNVVGGDLVVIDEATRYWSTDSKVKKGHAYFFREHRHFANELGHTCDLVVIDPDLTLLARALKGKVELASITHKPKEIGLNRYVVNLYRGIRLSRKPTSTLGPYKFKAEIYALYRSYAHADAKERPIDNRQNILRNPRFWMVGAGLVLLTGGCLWWLGSYYSDKVQKLRATSSEKPTTNSKGEAAHSVESMPAPAQDAEKTSYLRIAGEVTLRGERWVMLVDSKGISRLENPAAFVGKGVMMVGSIEGQRVTTWTGEKAETHSIAGGLK